MLFGKLQLLRLLIFFGSLSSLLAAPSTAIVSDKALDRKQPGADLQPAGPSLEAQRRIELQRTHYSHRDPSTANASAVLEVSKRQAVSQRRRKSLIRSNPFVVEPSFLSCTLILGHF